MGISKTHTYTPEQNNLACLAKALGHPARLAIVEYLLEVNTCICGDIVTQLPLSQATVSQHLKVLKEAKIIQGEIEGNAICYCLNKPAIDKFLSYLRSVSNKLELNTNCCTP